MAMENGSGSLEYTPTWIVAGVCFIIVFLSLCAERALHRLGKFLKRKKQDALFEALQKLKEELMLLGFISFLLTVFQSILSHICIPTHLASYMHPCKKQASEIATHGELLLQSRNNRRRLLSTDVSVENCAHKGQVPLLSIEALHQLHMFVFVLAVVHVIFCVSTMVLGGAKIRRWKNWEKPLWREPPKEGKRPASYIHGDDTPLHHEIFSQRASGYWRKAAIVSWMISFMKQFYGSVTKSDYIALRHGFIMTHCPRVHDFDFHKYMMRSLEGDFRKIVSISWFFWLFVVLFLLLNVEGWNSYFWLSFLPLVLLLLVGAKLEHIITRLAQEVDREAAQVKPSDEHFWFHSPSIVLWLIHFILFQNSFEIAFFFWIWSTYGLHSCIMEKIGFIIPRLIMGVVVQVLCSYSTLPLYALVTQMGSTFKIGEDVHKQIMVWAGHIGNRGQPDTNNDSSGGATASHSHRMAAQSLESFHVAKQARDTVDEATPTI
ncbi:MLO-like protein 13 [Syzygium oleosum]|uniref:MLO-like protein 13 n=1 Tax=Syzygium oleosum TaxID=219896 RepID=UPI0011D19AE7|nr:MLO-like protein 13 [Syzygium oleosum]